MNKRMTQAEGTAEWKHIAEQEGAAVEYAARFLAACGIDVVEDTLLPVDYVTTIVAELTAQRIAEHLRAKGGG